jgi:ATP-dependent Clp protease adaptor protein ClpS
MSVDILEEIKIDEKIKNETHEPSKFNVIMINDDHTPMEWVIDVLKTIFKHSEKSASSLTMTIHNEGSAIVGTYIHEIAEQKAVETVTASRNAGFPLQVSIEKE